MRREVEWDEMESKIGEKERESEGQRQREKYGVIWKKRGGNGGKRKKRTKGYREGWMQE